MEWFSDEPFGDRVVWWTRVDRRYQVEVHRIGDEPESAMQVYIEGDGLVFQGMLNVFDHHDSDALVHSEPVGVSFGAPMGADVADVQRWEQIALAVVDGLNSRLQ